MAEDICKLSFREAISAIGIVPVQSLRTELRVTAVQHPVLTRVLETVGKKAQAEIILALTERGAREVFFFDQQHARNSTGNPLTQPPGSIQNQGTPTIKPTEMLVQLVDDLDATATNGCSEFLCHIPP